MKTRLFVPMAICCLAAFFVVSLAGEPGAGTDPQTGPAVVPASLEAFYPPVSPGPTYLIAMHELATPFSGIVGDLFENDLANARADFEAFKRAYVKVAAMVPEWQAAFPMAPVDGLEAALAAGDPSAVMPAVEAVGRACHDCHVTSMVAVQHRFHWRDFGDLMVTDPLSGQEVSFGTLMKQLEVNFTGIGNDLAQGQLDNARRQLDGFEARFQAMAEACVYCHDTERRYYVDAEVTNLIADLKVELNKAELEPGAAGGLLMSIGQSSCAGCHRVHLPAAYAQQLVKGH